MADKNQQAYHPATTNGYNRSGGEEGAAPTAQANELRRQKRKKWLIYGLAFVVFQTGVILLFSMTVMKVRNPKFRVRSAAFESSSVLTNSTTFTGRNTVALGIKNPNFGPYKYDNSTMHFYFGETEVGSATIPKSKAQFLGTEKFTVAVDLALDGTSNSKLARDIGYGTVPLTSRSRLTGKVELMLIFKKKKSVDMDCTMELSTYTRALQNFHCK